MFWRVLLSSCLNCGVLLSWASWPGGSVEAGETARAGNFETSNPLTECQKSTQRGTCVSVVLPRYFGTGLLAMNVGFASSRLRSRISSSQSSPNEI